MTLDSAIQLHEQLEVVYLVSHYEARISIQDGGRQILKSKGDTVDEAIRELEKRLLNYNTIQELRKL